ncbi:MAG: oxidoreductase domain protein [Steroidobacteraceae bacterium]|nr:oxidoreductase domain protein [Steroidobacteraceae bacterium]
MKSISRRGLLKSGIAAAAVGAAPLFIPSRVWGANRRIRVGQIGCGRIAQAHDMPGVIKSGLADFVALCEVDSRRAADGVVIIEKAYADRGVKGPKIAVYKNYRELIARRDIDAVVISTPDHWHAELALSAIESGKDVYLQKPFTMTYAEGVILRDAVKRHGRILQVGSQQRSWEQFRRAAELIRSGRIGNVQRVEIGLPTDPTSADAPPEAIPANLDYGQWLGPTEFKYYTEQRVHPREGYTRPGWLRNDAYCLGMITGWGSHHYDTLNWALGFDTQGPGRIEGKGEFPDPSRIWNVHGSYDITLQYPKNITVNVSDKHNTGLKFHGDEGWLWVTREGTGATSSDPQAKGANLPPLDASNPRILDPNGLSVQLPVSKSHHRNWLESIDSRKEPLTPARVGHNSNTACIVSWIAMKLGRPLEWDHKAGKFLNDAEANSMLTRRERAPYGALKLARA